MLLRSQTLVSSTPEAAQDAKEKAEALRRQMMQSDGRWYDEANQTWRGRNGRSAKWPDLMEGSRQRVTRIVLAAAHMDGNPANNRLRNLRSL